MVVRECIDMLECIGMLECIDMQECIHMLECIDMPGGLPRRRTTSARVTKHAQTVFSGWNMDSIHAAS